MSNLINKRNHEHQSNESASGGIPFITVGATITEAANLAFATYIDQFEPIYSQSIPPTSGLIEKMANDIKAYISGNHEVSDWSVVWGPAMYFFPGSLGQANLTFIAQKQGTQNYVVATRGTVANDSLEWLVEDLNLGLQPWPTVNQSLVSPSNPNITPIGNSTPFVTHATATALSIVLNTNSFIQWSSTNTPSFVNNNPLSLSDFLQSISIQPAVVTFTGHSLGGAIAPALALWFKQSQGYKLNTSINSNNSVVSPNPIYYPSTAWDAGGNVTVAAVSFAGATPGEQNFVNYFSNQFNINSNSTATHSPYARITNTNDVVPYAYANVTGILQLYPEQSYSFPAVNLTQLVALEQNLINATNSSFILVEYGKIAYDLDNNKALVINVTKNIVNSSTRDTFIAALAVGGIATKAATNLTGVGNNCTFNSSFANLPTTDPNNMTFTGSVNMSSSTNNGTAGAVNVTGFMSQALNQHEAAYAVQYNITVASSMLK